MTGGRKQETRGTPSYTRKTAHFQQPLSHDLPLTPVPIMMAVANTYGCYCCCLYIRATQIWEPLAQVATTGRIPLWYHLSQHEFWETVATCSLHDALLNKQLLFCAGISVRGIPVYGPTFSALQQWPVAGRLWQCLWRQLSALLATYEEKQQYTGLFLLETFTYTTETVRHA